MTGFYYRDADLVCDGVPLAAVATVVGTPCYVYSGACIRERYREIDQAFEGHPHALHYALKANSTLGVVRLLRSLGAAVDVNSGGEMDVALRAGFRPWQIVFSGVGKTRGELERAIALELRAINVESPGELERIGSMAHAAGRRARVAVRVNPDIDAQSHPHVSTGLRTSKFGVPLDEARRICQAAAARDGLRLVGLHVHVGSQIVTLGPLQQAAGCLVALARQLGDVGVPLEHLDLGGGLGISYDGSPVPGPREYAAALLPLIQPSGLELLLEPGRVVVGPAGVLLARVVDVKPQVERKYFVVLDAGMTELVRPAFYGAYHRIDAVTRRPGREAVCDIVGPLCETSDVLGTDRRLPLPEVGDLLAVFDAGAYGSVMASNYNRRTQPAEVLVDQEAWRVVRRRQSIKDLLAHED